MITDTSNFRYPYYHCASGSDSVEQLDTDFTAGILAATAGAMAEELGIAD